MRVKFVVILFFLIVLTSFNALAIECGDCDGNGFVNIGDALLASRYSAGLAQLPEPQFSACNVAGTPGNQYYPPAQVSSIDSLKISQYVVGKIPRLDCILYKLIIFEKINSSGQSDLYTINFDGSSEAIVAFNGSNQSNEYTPSWSPDGKWIIFSSFRTGNYELYRLRANAAPQDEPEQLTNDSSSDGEPDWSPDGEDIVFSSVRSGNQEIYVLNLRTRIITQLTNTTTRESSPSWSPDGNQISYLERNTSSAPIDSVWRMDRNGQNKTKLSTGIYSSFDPDWGPSGKIVFSQFTGSPPLWQIFTMDGNGSNVVQITHESKVNHFGGSWLRDGSKILFHASRGAPTYMDLFSATPIFNGTITTITNSSNGDSNAAQ